MEIRQLEYFLAVVDNRGVAGASAVLSVAPPLVVGAVHSLEMELGARLFHRVDTGMRPSSAGFALIGPARQVVRGAAALTSELGSSGQELAGTVVLGVFAPLAVGPFADLIVALRRAHPGVRVRIVPLSGDVDDEANELSTGRVDFLFTHTPFGNGALPSIPLGVHQFVVVFPAGTVVPPGPVDLENLPPVPLVLSRGASYILGREVEALLAAAPRRPDLAVVMEQREGWLPLVEAGVCAGMFDRSVVEELSPDLPVRPVRRPTAREYGLVYEPERLDSVGTALVELARGLALDTPRTGTGAARDGDRGRPGSDGARDGIDGSGGANRA